MEEEQITRTMLCAANEKQGADTCAVSVKNDQTGEKERKREKLRCPQDILKKSLAKMLETKHILAEMLKI